MEPRATGYRLAVNYPAPDGGSDLVIDATAMAADADVLGRSAHAVSQARDSINGSWKMGGEAFGSSLAAEAFDLCCSTWIQGTDTISHLTGYVAEYTQDIATYFGATDTSLAATATEFYTKADMPKPGDKRYIPYQDPNMA